MVEAWYDPTNQVVSTDKNDPRFTSLGQLWRLVPEREWVGLTHEEVKYFVRRFDWRQPPETFSAVIEAKLREKNV
jgi:hypothetical protein